jgi:hypothetical protein
MNKTPLGFEKILYDVLMVSDERTSISELSTILEINIDLVIKAVSLLSRLGFAKKKIEKPVLLF